jgi:cytochrome c peroxidase
MGGVKIPFKSGRVDCKLESECPPNGRLPDASKNARHVREVFYRMGFTDREIVCLVGGGHTIGRCHKDRSGFEGPWTNQPTGFTNLYFRVILSHFRNYSTRSGKSGSGMDPNSTLIPPENL